MSGRCLGVVRVTLDTAWGDMICKQLITIQLDSSKLPFFFSPSCLGLVNTALGDMICKQLVTMQLDSSILRFSFSPSCLRLVKTAIFWGVCRVSGRCLGGVWWVSCTLRIVSGAYRCQINCNKSCRDDQLSVIHFLPVAYFGLWPCCSAESVKYVCLI